jgi:hypothetical protein
MWASFTHFNPYSKSLERLSVLKMEWMVAMFDFIITKIDF